MSLVSTTIAAAVTATDRVFNLTSGTSVAVGRMLRVNDEFMSVQGVDGVKVTVQRGKWGTAAIAHGILSIAVHGDPADFPYRPLPRLYTYGIAAPAITQAPGIHVFARAGVCAATLLAPGANHEGEKMLFVARTAQAHTITLSSGYFNGATNTKATFGGAIGDCLEVVVVGGNYCVTVNKNITLAAS